MKTKWYKKGVSWLVDPVDVDGRVVLTGEVVPFRHIYRGRICVRLVTGKHRIVTLKTGSLLAAKRMVGGICRVLAVGKSVCGLSIEMGCS